VVRLVSYYLKQLQSNSVITNTMGLRILFDIAVIRNIRERNTCMY
jgi:hypothetical protein